MEYKTYLLERFSITQVKKGRLCVATKMGYTSDMISTDSAAYITTGIPTMVSPTECTMSINGVVCQFDERGYQRNSYNNLYQLFLGTTDIEVQQYGNAIKRAKKVVTIRTKEGVKTEIMDYSAKKADDDMEKNVLISSLNARDNFALRALQCILPSIPDLKSVGDNERDYYCKMAYDWAANMMDHAAQVRATFEDTTTSTEQSTDITELETNTDKLLNNILFTMERAQKITVDGEHEIVSNRMATPDLTEALLAQTTAMTTTLNSVKSALVDVKIAIANQSTALNNQTTALNAIKDSVIIQTTAINSLKDSIATQTTEMENQTEALGAIKDAILANNITSEPVETTQEE